MRFVPALAAIFAAGPALAACPPPAQMQAAAAGWLAGQRLPDPVVASMADAACAYTAFRGGLEAAMGKPVGVKVSFTSKPVQDRFGVTEPATGALFAPMIVPDEGGAFEASGPSYAENYRAGDANDCAAAIARFFARDQAALRAAAAVAAKHVRSDKDHAEALVAHYAGVIAAKRSA